ncbi:hypothetical protein C2G38_2221694 [Gigaspora rosea]|uniref:HMG box domain-containing protein n=1 Tax=Gigaspora rosea TaxID=44941 RepID=A0A397U3B9_9GLOM|nr:hypothetical protein C2G38_2221694 [Gigaspora rosea]
MNDFSKVIIFLINNRIRLEIQKRYQWLSNNEVSKLAGILWNMLDPKVKEEFKQLAIVEQLEFQKNNNNKKNSASGYLDIISNGLKNIIENKKTEDEESGERNNAQEPYSEKNQVKENDIHKAYNEYTSFDYHQEFGQLSLNNFDQIGVFILKGPF